MGYEISSERFESELSHETSSVEHKRAQLTISCRDSDSLPKVDGAGECFGDLQEFQRMHNGLVIKTGSYHGQWMTEIIRQLRGHHEPQEEKVFAEILRNVSPNAIMVELGSFWAYYSMWFQQEKPNGISVLVEPNPDKIKVGQEHLKLNKQHGTFLKAFVGDRDLPAAIFRDWDGTTYPLRQITVDSLMKEYGLTRIDILHADIQGAEYKMLLGAREALLQHAIQYLLISTHAYEHERCFKLLKQYGYRIITDHSVLESFSGDGLIVACSPDCSRPGRIEITRRKVRLRESINYKLGYFKQRLLMTLRELFSAKSKEI